ncbi:MAG TPA: PDZ domain-containing protein [Planctomycetota bacterium]|nr:PDZ domain-containing protein [Planctomycetota bacterium]
MSVGLWKNVLGIAKVGAVLVIVGSALLFWGHRRAMAAGWEAPDFSPPVAPYVKRVADTTSLSIPLGRFQKERGPVAPPPKEEKKEDVTTALAKLGEIIGGTVIYPPYEEGGFAPAINFRWKMKPAGDDSDVRTIRLGEALEERSSGPNRGTPLKYQFVGCERDPANPGYTYFLFDMKCDGTDIQKVHWKLEEPSQEQVKKAEPAPTNTVVSNDKVYVGPGPGKERPAEPEQVQPVETPVAPAPPPVKPVVMEQEAPTGSFFDEDNGVLQPTQNAVDYLEKNYEKILEDTRTETYRGRDFSGIRVVGIANASVASQFGIRKDDVIISINNVAVTSQSEAVNVVKNELKRKVNLITVKLRRAGREITKTYDTRDPATRRAAKSFGR